MADIYVGFSTSNSFISKAIRYFRGSQFSHTFVVVGKFWERFLIAEAGSFTVSMATLDRMLNPTSKIELWELRISDKVLEQGISASLGLIGRSYGYFQLLGFIWIWLCDKMGLRRSNPFHDGVICSEFVYYFLKEVGFTFAGLKPDDTAPDDILKILQRDNVARLAATKDYGETALTWML